MNIIEYRDWVLIVDTECTKETYKKVALRGSESCTCVDCKNFVNNLESIYPKEVKELFYRLGIDYRKDCETWKMCKEENGLHRYSGWFHFKGMFKGKSCIEKTGENTSSLNLTSITESFSIGFCYDNALTHFEEKENLVQVEFEVKVPWTIDKLLEYN